MARWTSLLGLAILAVAVIAVAQTPAREESIPEPESDFGRKPVTSPRLAARAFPIQFSLN
jgi:hypothetical protein